MDDLAAALSAPEVRLLVVVGYLAGSVPFGLILGRLVAGKDVRAAGSGNIGATNVARVAGRALGLVTLALDVLKGAAPVLLAAVVTLPAPAASARALVEGLVALAAVLGHCFPVWLRFKGGKGVATGLGVLLAHRPDVAAAGLVAFAVVFGVARRVSAGSVAAACAVVVALLARGPRDATLVPVALCMLLIVAKHHANIRRLIAGRELKV